MIIKENRSLTDSKTPFKGIYMTEKGGCNPGFVYDCVSRKCYPTPLKIC